MIELKVTVEDEKQAESLLQEQQEEPLRTISSEELANCITLDELNDELTKMIHKHFHPEA